MTNLDACHSTLDALLDDNKWPTYTEDLDTSSLDKLAQEAYSRDTVDGYLSYILMTNQMCEEYTRVLVRHSQFTLLLHLVPRGFDWRFGRNQTGSRLTELMFGKLLDLLETSMEFRVKSEFIQRCRNLNQIRNRLAHQLARNSSLEELRRFAAQHRTEYDEVVHLFNQADDEFAWHYALMTHDILWDHMIEEGVTKDDPGHRARWETLRTRLQEERVKSPVSELKGTTRFIRNT